MVDAQPDQHYPSWEVFCGARLDYVRALAETVEQSFLRRDTTHPTFCGCIDWHSSVHGAYALLTASRLTSEPRWVRVVDAALAPDCLEGELAALKRGDLDHELPYGFAWFLKLAQEREHGCGKNELQPLATEIALRVGRWLFSLSDEDLANHVQRCEYGNLSWPLVNLWHWGKWKQDSDLLKELANFTRIRLLPLNQECPPSLDQVTDEFFPAALQRCRALLTILPPEDSGKWLAAHIQDIGRLSPLTSFPTVHSAGLNFSRSWGLWTVYQHTKDPVFRDLYVNHIATHMHMPQYWRDDYRKHGHWVPQFGIYAIALSFDEAPF
ncbi:DUF2891 family protein [Candidatus Nitrospira allomarina]|uniref:DUF2891 family protein n=1 Tax=Candidatus Nitrospira allomarina TaxID=3020900 RepID=A0AA96GHI8_9BACT|nr:DUF2891 family protein [Candidatus Nitrospira allomarina]WNM57821.1 DUF2891 family protein [Candidatus Nitrospira allomarina]